MRVVSRVIITVVSIFSYSVGALCAEAPKATNCTQTAPVCAVKAGARQSYWNACQASREGATIVLAGECPSSPNSDGGGGGGGSGGM